jgi:hypothetical protein
MWKYAVVASSKGYPGIWLEAMRKVTKNPPARTAGFPAEIRTERLPDTSLYRYHCANRNDFPGFIGDEYDGKISTDKLKARIKHNPRFHLAMQILTSDFRIEDTADV